MSGLIQYVHCSHSWWINLNIVSCVNRTDVYMIMQLTFSERGLGNAVLALFGTFLVITEVSSKIVR